MCVCVLYGARSACDTVDSVHNVNNVKEVLQ